MDNNFDPSLQSLSKVMEVQFGSLKEQIKTSNEHLESKMKISDDHFDKRISKIEAKLDNFMAKVEDKFESRTADIAVLKNETAKTSKSWSGLIALVAGSVASIIVAFVSRILGL